MANPHGPFFGRTERDWEELEAAGWELLAHPAGLLTTYTDLNKAWH